MAMLHYREAAFQIARAGMVAGQDPVWDMLLSFAASAEVRTAVQKFATEVA